MTVERGCNSGGQGMTQDMTTVTSRAVPGSDTVRITRVAGDVAGCTAVGNVKAHFGTDGNGPIVGDEVKFRNQVIGFGGNVGFVTLEGAYKSPAEGVAYRCTASL
jgi:hypothetical protein